MVNFLGNGGVELILGIAMLVGAKVRFWIEDRKERKAMKAIKE